MPVVHRVNGDDGVTPAVHRVNGDDGGRVR